MSEKEEFLTEHNRLSSPELQATKSMLSKFRKEKPYVFRKSGWSVEKVRRPFVLWLTSLTEKERKEHHDV